MSIQHAQAAVCDYYDYRDERWTTPRSSYARAYLAVLCGERSHLSQWHQHLLPEADRRRIEAHIDREFHRPNPAFGWMS